MKRLIVTGDDFGLSHEVNAAIETAHTQGILSAASLMMGAPAAADAVERARRLPGLHVGLHVTLVKAKALCAPTDISALAPHGDLPDNQVLAGFRFAISRRMREDLAREIEAQFQAFARTGLVLDHVNGHCHMHLHPVVLRLILQIGPRYGMTAMRIVREPAPPRPSMGARLQSWVIAPWDRAMRQRLQRAGIACNDQLFGLNETGRMDADALLDILDRLPEGASEIYCHPGAAPGETDALIDERVRRRLSGLGLAPGGYRDLIGAAT